MCRPMGGNVFEGHGYDPAAHGARALSFALRPNIVCRTAEVTFMSEQNLETVLKSAGNQAHHTRRS
jgi:hypothetical protein